jgi:hypothetical protein
MPKYIDKILVLISVIISVYFIFKYSNTIDTHMEPYYITPVSNNNAYFISVLDPHIRKFVDVPYNFENKTVGYFNTCEYDFIQAIIDGYRMDASKIDLKKLNIHGIKQLLQTIRLNKIDILIMYVEIGSETYKYIQNERVSILGFENMDFTRIKVFYPNMIATIVSLRKLFIPNPINKLLIPNKDDHTVLPKLINKVYCISADKLKLKKNVEKFITRIKLDPEALKGGYKCYGGHGNEFNISKAECESPNDMYGKRKHAAKWDKLCTTNEECPFYKKNTHYSNNRGGCIGGLCEMPIGVLQASPKKFFDIGKFKPFCYGCNAKYNNTCCNKTKDYAFPNDSSDRQKAGLKTSISLM